jgi:predicted GTPase
VPAWAQENVRILKERAHERNPKAAVVATDSVVTVSHPELVRGKRVVTVDDGPTLTHGGAPFGAGARAGGPSPWPYTGLVNPTLPLH